MNKFTSVILFFVLFGAFTPVLAQESMRDSVIGFGFLNVDYGGFAPGGDIQKRFGFSSYIGPVFGYHFNNNFYVQTGVQLGFGSEVKEAIADNILTLFPSIKEGYSGVATGVDGRQTEVRFFQRGFTVPLIVGKIFPVLKKPNPNSGFYLEVGTQFMQHKVKIEVIGDDIPGLTKELKKGYDRLTNGFGIIEGAGYSYHSNKNFVNFYFGVQLSQNFTKGRRAINYDTGIIENNSRIDLQYGIKIGWSIPIYQKADDETYFF